MPESAPSRSIPFPSTGPGSVAWWSGQLDWATDVRKDLLPSWRLNANAYRGKTLPPRPEGVRVNIEFEKTEQKKYQLFYRLPELKLRAHPRTLREAQAQTPGQPVRDLKKAIAIFREVLTYQIGKHGANTKPVMDEVLFDVLCPAGIGAAKVGYERYEDGTIPIQTGAMIPDPTFTPPPGSILGLHPTPLIPETSDAPNVIAEKYYCARISPAKLLIPPDFTGSDYTQAAWLGHDFWITKDEAIRRGWTIPEHVTESQGDDEDRLVELDKKGQRQGQLHCREIFYYAQRLDPTVMHPDKIRRMVLIAKVKEPILHQDLKDQQFDPNGKLIGGLKTLPIKICTLRYVSDTPFPPSDCQITRHLADEVSEFRTQMVIHRRKAVPMRGYDINKIMDERVKDQLKKGDPYDLIPSDGPGADAVWEVARANYPRENYSGNDYCMNDINRLWSLPRSSAEGGGAPETATAIAAIREAGATRLSAEHERVVQGFWISLVEAIGALVQLYADREDVVEIVGPTGEASLEAWDRSTIQGEFLYDIVPNSAAQPDAAGDRDLALNRYNLLANDPFINREQLVKDTVEAWDGDPERLVRVPEPAPPEKPRISLSISGKDLDPFQPQYANVVNLLQVAGIPAHLSPIPSPPAEGEQVAAGVVDRERLRMAGADNADQRAGGLVGVGR